MQDLLRRLPALRRIGFLPRRRVPFVQQLSSTDCGAACVAMVLGYHGCEVGLAELRDHFESGRDGNNAARLLEVARSFGLRGRGLSLELPELRLLAPGAILFWEFNHFVVFEGWRRSGLEIVDPAIGRRLVRFEEVGRDFTGVALELEPTREMHRRRRSRRGRFAELLGSQAPVFARLVAMSLLVQLLVLAVPLLTALVVDRVLPWDDRRLLEVVGIGLAGLIGFQLLVQLIRSHLMLRLRTELDVRLTASFVDHLVTLPFSFFQRRSSGDLLMRINSNASVRELLATSTLSTLLDGSMAAIYLLLLLVASPRLALLVAVLAGVRLLVFVATRRSYLERLSQVIKAEARSQGFQYEMLGGIQTIKAAGAEAHTVEHWSHLFVRFLNAQLERGRLEARLEAFMASLSQAAPLAVLWLGTVEVLAGRLSLGTMLALNALALGFLVPFASLIQAAASLLRLRTHVERLEDVLDSAAEQQGAPRIRAPKLRGSLEIDNLSFSYAPGAPRVLKNISATVEPGEFVAVVGRSGSGKSTLVQLLLGLYPPVSGRILFDDILLAELDLRSLRRQVGTVLQNPHLFSGSIRSNIAHAEPGLPFEDIVRAARQAHIHDEIVAMPMGYETVVSDGGQSLSGGQRQRIALARALAREPRLLVLDEATSALDAESEKKILSTLADLSSTRLVVAHRLSTFLHADRILVLDAGRLVEEGTHADLLAAGNRYADLVRDQLAPPGPIAPIEGDAGPPADRSAEPPDLRNGARELGSPRPSASTRAPL